MAQCKYCDQSGWFFPVNPDGLCRKCAPMVQLDVSQRVRVLNDSLRHVNTSKKLDVQLSRCDILLDHARALHKYEERGIPSVNPAPSYFLETYKNKKDELILASLTDETEKAKTKADLASGVKSKLTHLSKTLFKVQAYKGKADNPSILGSLEKDLRELIHATQINGFLEDAKRAEFKGQTKKALESYYDALYFLKNDDIEDSLQSEHLNEIEGKIASLGGHVPVGD